jgi:hypothetical protein
MARGKAKNLGPWCRLYASILDNPKLERLSDSVFRAHIKMMAVATVYGGMIPLDLDDVAIRLRKPLGKVRDLVQVLLSANLLERTNGGYIIHDWVEMQFDSDVSTGRVKQFRERQKTDDETEMKRFKPVAATPDETAPDTEADTDTEAEKKQPEARDARLAAEEPEIPTFLVRKPKPKPFEPPEWVPRDAWECFVKFRKRGKAPWTDDAADLTVRELAKLRDGGQDLAAVLNQSVQRGWTGVFPLKERSNGSTDRANPHDKFFAGGLDALDKYKAA